MRGKRRVQRRHGAAVTALRAALAPIRYVHELGPYAREPHIPLSSRSISTAHARPPRERRISVRQVMASAPRDEELEVRAV